MKRSSKIERVYVVTNPAPEHTELRDILLATWTDALAGLIGTIAVERGPHEWSDREPALYTDPEEAFRDARARWIAAGRPGPADAYPGAGLQPFFALLGVEWSAVVGDLLGDR
ncbi:MAG: hypothetical protein EKK55_07060 [Rhodocyclaceae bacterium]|nr:MAG: hypothetical protein EKK55_07060 [Rhodocyclaceae bacterium]